jgi:enoyl-CoA hydratase
MKAVPQNVDDELLVEVQGRAALVTLNRPHALNAVTHNMVRALSRMLDEAEADPAIAVIVLRGAGEKAFSAGGDIRALYDLITAGRHDEALAFWHEEYTLNHRIRTCPKPYVSLIDGIVMGGGAGVSINGAYRVAGDRFSFAMPEVGIGFFPDVGATWFLPRLPDQAGTWLALTGDRVKAQAGLALGLATHRVPSASFAHLTDALADPEAGAVGHVLSRFHVAAEAPPEVPRTAGLFAGATLEEIIQALENDSENAFAQHCRSAIAAKSPTSLRIALRQMRVGAHLSFAECMALEYRIVSRLIHEPDFVEGIRAVIIDKDNAPRWSPPTLAGVSERNLAHHFASLGAADLNLPEPVAS